jgi:hypothetical protein
VKRWLWWAGVALLVGVIGVGLIAHHHTASRPRALTGALPPAVAPARGLTSSSADTHRPRVRVEVLNATDRRGLARTATGVLRDAGFDVVVIGNAPAHLDSTVVVDRTGHAAWAHEAAAVLRHARVSVEPDSSRYVDLSVLLGESWSPPPQPFRP